MSRALGVVALLAVFSTAGVLQLLSRGIPAPQGNKSEKTKKTEAAVLSAAPLVTEKGKFRILLDGQNVGTEEFEISPAGADWQAHGATEIHTPTGTTKVTAWLRLAGTGAPLHYEWSTQSQKKASASVDFQGGTAKMALRLEGAQPFVQELSFDSPRVIILDNNLYHQYAILARIYDWNAKGAQTFPVLVPQDMTPGSITVESLGPQSIDDSKFEVLRVHTADLEVNLYLDTSHRLLRLAVPASKAAVVRE